MFACETTTADCERLGRAAAQQVSAGQAGSQDGRRRARPASSRRPGSRVVTPVLPGSPGQLVGGVLIARESSAPNLRQIIPHLANSLDPQAIRLWCVELLVPCRLGIKPNWERVRQLLRCCSGLVRERAYALLERFRVILANPCYSRRDLGAPEGY